MVGLTPRTLPTQYFVRPASMAATTASRRSCSMAVACCFTACWAARSRASMGSPSLLSMGTEYITAVRTSLLCLHTALCIVVCMTSITAPAAAEGRCLAPNCGRKLTDPKSVALGYGPKCAAKVRAAAKTADLSAWTPAQVEQARELIEDGGVVPSSREGVFHTVSADGTETHLTHPAACNCTSGLKTHQPRPCYHRCAVVIVLATQAPAAPAPAPVTVPAPAPAGDLWAEMDRLTDAFMTAA